MMLDIISSVNSDSDSDEAVQDREGIYRITG